MEARIKTKPKSSEWAPGEGHQPRQTSEPAVRRRDVRAGEKMEKPRGAHTGMWGRMVRARVLQGGARGDGGGSCSGSTRGRDLGERPDVFRVCPWGPPLCSPEWPHWTPPRGHVSDSDERGLGVPWPCRG